MKYVTTQVFSFDEHKIDSSALQIVASELEKGKIVAFPTETVYGIGALENYPDAIDAIYELKGRSNKKPLAIYINNLNQVKQMKLELPSFFDDFVALFWPGPVTLLVQDVNKQKQGIRYADNCTVNSILSLLKHQLRGTSANESGSECLITAQDVYKKFKNKIDYIVDTGKCKYGTESTVLDVSTKPCIVIRKGLKYKEIEKYLKEKYIAYRTRKKILVVCTGNTCRSPMVRGWLSHLFSREDVSDYFELESCGVYAPFSMSPSRDAIDVLSDEGIDISWHRSKSLSVKLTNDADKIIVMTADHKLAITSVNNKANNKIMVLDIPDPIGRGSVYYKQIFNMMKEKIKENYHWIVA